MIPTTNVDNQLTGSLGGERVAMSVDLSSLSHIMTVLTDLYSDPELAVIREYSTNAIDSHKMAGVDRPIEVYLPTALRQTFEVRDFGLGMSPAEITEVYGSYGSSTKRDRNDANGCLGLGSKSALTYTNMFTVRAIKNGTLTECAIYRDEFGAGSIEVVDTKATDEPNGVTIIVPTSANSSFEEKAKNFYAVWDKGTVLVDGAEPEYVVDHPKALWVDDKTLVVPCENNYRGVSDYVVMGGVSYPAGNGDSWRSYKTFYFASMGDDTVNAEVDFVPSREALNFNTKTTAVTSALIRNTSEANVSALVQDKITKAKNITAAVKLSQEYAFAATYRGFVYKGDRIIDRLSVEDTRKFDHTTTHAPDMNTKFHTLYTAQKDRYVWIQIPAGKPFSFTLKARIRKYAETLNFDPIFLLGTPPKHAQFQRMKSVKVAELEKIDIPKVKRGAAAPKIQPEYHYVYQGMATYQKQKLPTDKGVKFLWSPKWLGNYSFRELTTKYPKVCVVLLPDNRIKKFCRDNPKAMTVEDFKAKEAKKVPALTDIQVEAHNLSKWDREDLESISKHVTDQHITDLLAVDRAEVAKIVEKWYTVGKNLPSVSNYMTENFPLASYRSYPNETIAYINSIIAERN